MSKEFQREIAAVQSIEAVPRILEVVCTLTGMGFAAVARVTAERWVALAVRDEINFGLLPGGELKVETTICSEIQDSGSAIVIDHVDKDEIYCVHPTPKMYGFQSYISVPIVLPNGRFFGTLCAIDPEPRKLNTPQVTGTFKLFAELIAYHLEAAERVTIAETTLAEERRLFDREQATIRERDEARSELHRTTALFEAVINMTPDLVFVKDLDSKALLRNPAARFGRTWEEFQNLKESEWHRDPQEAAQVVANDRKVIESGQSMQFEEQFTTPLGVRTLLSTKSPLLDELGKIIGTIGVSTDITDRQNRAKHVEFIMRELSHRSKNLLAIIQSVARQSIMQSSSLEEFEEHFTGRLGSLASLHDLLIQEDWRGASFRAIAETQIGPFAGERVSLNGPELLLRPDIAQVISMVFHELSTNASKYGSLSNQTGTVAVTWGPVAGKDALFIRWQETGGPAVQKPTRKGFGSIVLERIALQVPKATVALTFPTEGVVWTLEAPAKSLADRAS
jgi:PAS domain S-box-containing protein